MIKGFTCGVFDLTHTGHALMLAECKKYCGYLIVGLQLDPNIDRKEKERPIQTISERYLMLRAIRYVDEIVPYETEEELLELLRSLMPDVRVLGEDWGGKRFTGDELPIKIVYNKRCHNYSTSNLKKRIKMFVKQ